MYINDDELLFNHKVMVYIEMIEEGNEEEKYIHQQEI